MARNNLPMVVNAIAQSYATAAADAVRAKGAAPMACTRGVARGMRLPVLACALVAVLLFAYALLAQVALADEAGTPTPSRTPDYAKTGSITVEVISTDTKARIPGGTLTAYEVASAQDILGDASFVPTDDFAASGVTTQELADVELSAVSLAARLAAYAEEAGLPGTTVEVSGDGVATFGDLELGLYLIVQKEAANGYEDLSPFLVTVPLWDGEKLVYDVLANPKPGTANTKPDEPDKPDKPRTPTGPTLPQTGQLWWPVPWLVAGGMALVIAGVARRMRKGAAGAGEGTRLAGRHADVEDAHHRGED